LNASVKYFFVANFRSAVSSFVMFFVVHCFLFYIRGVVGDSLMLFFSVLLGVFVYSVTVFSLWVLSGRPVGSESFLLGGVGLLFVGMGCNIIKF